MSENLNRPAPRLGLRDRWKIARYLGRMDEALPDLISPADFRRWRALRSDLRAGVLAAALDVGVDQALADLGPVEVLAREYDLAIRGPRAPMWMRGAIAAVGLLAGLTALWVAYTAGLAKALTYVGGGVTPWVYVLGLRTQASSDGRGTSVAVTLTPLLWWFLASLIVFLLVARVWRLWRRPATA